MSIWQTVIWQKMLQKSSQTENFFEFSGFFIEKRKIGFKEMGLFIIGTDFSKFEENLEEKLIKLCKKEDGLFIQAENIYYSEIYNFSGDKARNKNFKMFYFKKGYYKKFISPYTAIIDLKMSKEEILLKMKPKGRYNIKLAEKKGVFCEIVKKTHENIKNFYDLLLKTTKRGKFSGNTLNYYKTFLQEIENSELILAYKDYEVIAGGIFIFDKDISIYYYGASSYEHRNFMAPYLLQRTAIVYAKNIGSFLYDFLGVSSVGDKSSSLAGVTDFKLKLTQDIRNVSTSYIFVNKSFKYMLIKFLKNLRK